MADRDSVARACLAKPGAEETYPFGETVTVYKVGGKMFALLPVEREPATVSLKCDPELAELLRTTYPGSVVPGYHLSKRHWNTITLDGSVPDAELTAMLDHSYEVVVDGLPRRLRAELGF
jgi:predicted DNA-binding protein (MmcQ/YjbR family)